MAENKVRQLEPQVLWNHFEDLNAVPRPSKKEEKVREFMVRFAQGQQLEYKVDKVGNVIIRKPATPGMENRRPVVLQSHLDMVHQKNEETEFDFNTQGIQSYIDGEWVKARGTTLGADNGIGVAAIMAVLSSRDIPHPPLEALFTIDEESGMTGAHNLRAGELEGEILMNLDTEDDDELSIGCAGGIDLNIQWDYKEESTPSEHRGLEVKIRGLFGGHSGMDIIYGRGNANKLMNRLLRESPHFGVRISSIDGGSLRNAIPRESTALLAVPEKHYSDFCDSLDMIASDLKTEFTTTDPALKISYTEIEEAPEKSMLPADQQKFLFAVASCHDGIGRLSPDVKDLVETSNNIARLKLMGGELSVQCLTRSDRESAKMDMAQRVAAPFELLGAKVEMSGDYPGWKLNPNAPMLQMMKQLYIELFDDKPRVLACHAGLECGLLGQHYPDLEMISFGPTIRHPHSPDEKVLIPSVAKFWKFLQQALQRVPEKKS